MKPRQPTLGGLLRSLRARNQWTLKQMSEHSGIPLSTLSKIEHDRLSLTYDKLLQLGQRLNLSMSELFDESGRLEFADSPTAPRAATARRSIARLSDAPRITSDHYDTYYLCGELRRKRMIPTLVDIRARDLSQFGPLLRHRGEEFVYVLEGTVQLHTEFYDVAVLRAGEASYIDADMGHAYVLGEACAAARVLAVRACDEDEESPVTGPLDPAA